MRGALAAFALATLAACWLLWPLALHPGTHHAVGAFHDGHVWCFDHIAKMLTGQEPWGVTTDRIGWPGTAQLQLIAWLPAVLATPVNLLLGPLAGYNLLLLTAPGFAALTTCLLLQRVTGARDVTCAGASLLYALSPYVLGVLASGQTAKLWHALVPLWLLTLSWAARSPRWAGMIGAPLVAGMMAFTVPSYALYLPFLAAPFCLGELVVAKKGRIVAALCMLVALGATAGALLGAKGYYDAATVEGATRAFRPATAVPLGTLLVPAQMAQIEEVLHGLGDIRLDPLETNHVTYLGVPFLVFCGLCLLVPARGKWFGLTATLVGLGLAGGPYLAGVTGYWQLDGELVKLPAWWLDQHQYPTSRSGMYYRAVLLASLGLSALVAGALGRLGPVGPAVAVAVGLAHPWDALRVHPDLYPRQVRQLPGLALYERMAADPIEGAVLDYPVFLQDTANGRHLLAATIHGRAVAALPKDNNHVSQTGLLDDHVRFALKKGSPAEARAHLFGQGIAFVTWNEELVGYGPAGVSRDALIVGLGQPDWDDGVQVWRLAP